MVFCCPLDQQGKKTDFLFLPINFVEPLVLPWDLPSYMDTPPVLQIIRGTFGITVFHKTIHCAPSLESSSKDSSKEGVTMYVFIKKHLWIIPVTHSYLQLCNPLFFHPFHQGKQHFTVPVSSLDKKIFPKGSTFKRWICFYRSKFFHLRVEPNLKRGQKSKW